MARVGWLVVVTVAAMLIAGCTSAASGDVRAAQSPTAPQVELHDVPDLTGLSQASAEASLVAIGLQLGSVTTTYSTTLAAGLVTSQIPTASAAVESGSRIDIVISKGRAPIAVPSVVGKTEQAATKLLRALGFKVTIKRQHSAKAEGLVLSQAPKASGTSRFGSNITIVLSSGPQPTANGGGSSSSSSSEEAAKADMLARAIKARQEALDRANASMPK